MDGSPLNDALPEADACRGWDAIVVGEYAGQDGAVSLTSARGDGPEKRRYLLAGLLVCGACGRRMESAWSNGNPAYRCRHGYTTASVPCPERPKNAYVRESTATTQTSSTR